MLTLLDPRLWLAALALVASSYGLGRWHQSSADTKAQTALILKATQDARKQEQKWHDDINTLEKQHAAEVTSIAAARDAALRGLRNRPARLPDATLSARDCSGSTGRQLSREDAEFLVGFAADAERLNAALRVCQAEAEVIRQPD